MSNKKYEKKFAIGNQCFEISTTIKESVIIASLKLVAKIFKAFILDRPVPKKYNIIRLRIVSDNKLNNAREEYKEKKALQGIHFVKYGEHSFGLSMNKIILRQFQEQIAIGPALLASVIAWSSLLYLIKKPYIMFHASGVETKNGIMLISGSSGIGKSTLLSNFIRYGYGFYSDDAVLIAKRRNGNELLSFSKHGRISLPKRSNNEKLVFRKKYLHGLFWMIDEAKSFKKVPYTPKSMKKLYCIFFIEKMEKNGVKIVKLSKKESTAYLLKYLFANPLFIPEFRKKIFKRSCDIAASTACFRISYKKCDPQNLCMEIIKRLEKLE